jgi:GNAT superfamily N-acetyltransferase
MKTLFENADFSARVEPRSAQLEDEVYAYLLANPDYEILACGELQSREVLLTDFFEFQPPEPMRSELTHAHKAMIRNHEGELIGLLDIYEHLRCTFHGQEWTKGVCHIGLFHIAQHLHGTGLAQVVMQVLEQWARDQGFVYLRLGVLQVNPRGMRFWRAQGFEFIEQLEGVVYHLLSHTQHVCIKPLKQSPG